MQIISLFLKNGGVENAHMDVKSVHNEAHLVGYAREIRNISPLSVDDELVLVDPGGKNQDDGMVLARLLQRPPARWEEDGEKSPCFARFLSIFGGLTLGEREGRTWRSNCPTSPRRRPGRRRSST